MSVIGRRMYMELKNAVFWDVAPYRYCVNRRFGGTSVYTISTRRHIPQNGIHHSHRRENLKYYEYGAVAAMRIGRGNRSTRRKHNLVLFCPPQIPRNLIWNWDVDNFNLSSGVWKKEIHLYGSILYPPHFVLSESAFYYYFKLWTDRKSGGRIPKSKNWLHWWRKTLDDISVSLSPQWNLSRRHSTSIIYGMTMLYFIDISLPPTSPHHHCCHCI
jgi:hypothetical protein